MKPTEAGKLLGMGRSTITAWTANPDFKPFFSPTAQGGEGHTRNLTEHDLRLLLFIRDQKAGGVTGDELVVTLTRMQDADWVDLPKLPNTPSNFVSVPVVPAAAADAALTSERRALMREIAVMSERVKDLQQRLDQSNTDRESLLRELAAAQRELELWRSGRLKPE